MTARIKKEFSRIHGSLPDGTYVGLVDPDDLYNWEARIEGPADTPYEGGIFKLNI